jgi:hypothetical protein
VANTICERFVGSLHRELLDRILIVNAAYARTVFREYASHLQHSAGVAGGDDPPRWTTVGRPAYPDAAARNKTEDTGPAAKMTAA